MLYTINFDKENKIYYRRANFAFDPNHRVVEIGYNSIPKKSKQIFKRDVFIIHYIISGHGKCNGEKFSKNHCYFIVPNELEITEAANDDSYESCWIMLKSKNSKEMLENMGFPKHNCVFEFRSADECAQMIKNYLFTKQYKNEHIEALKLEELLYRLLSMHIDNIDSSISTNDNKEKAKIAAKYMENNYQTDIKISDLCAILHISPNHLYTIFRENYNISPKEYLISFRLSKAKQLLREVHSNIRVSEISYAVGIDNPLYFSRLFHKREGVSPTEYRNNFSDKNRENV